MLYSNSERFVFTLYFPVLIEGGGMLNSWVMMLLIIIQAPSVSCIPSWAMTLLSVSISSMLIVLCCCASLMFILMVSRLQKFVSRPKFL